MGRWINFILLEERPKTKIWAVDLKNGITLGFIKWFSHWRKYAFFPLPDTIYENDCLRDIIEFIELQMKNRKEHKCRL